jgi:hypothetical protein
MINMCHILSFVRLSRVLGFSTRATVSTSNASLQTVARKNNSFTNNINEHTKTLRNKYPQNATQGISIHYEISFITTS